MVYERFNSIWMKVLSNASFYLSIAIYFHQRQPQIDKQLNDDYKIEEQNFNRNYVMEKTLHIKIATEVRALRDA